MDEQNNVRIASAVKDEPHVTPDWDIAMDLIDGVRTREVRNIVTSNGITTEVHRDDWGVVDGAVEQVIHVSLRAGAISAWHMHERKTDHLMVMTGHVRAVLYDGREASPTAGRLNVLHLSPARPTLVVIPPGVWHGLQNLADVPSSFVNYFDLQYDYTDPDDWRLPPDTGRDPLPVRMSEFVLTLWTADPELAERADAAGIDRVGVDFERLGKRERQAGVGTWISPHTLEDLAAVGAALRRARLFVRVNPLNPASEDEIERAIDRGAQVVMLPMFTTAEEVAEFVGLLAGRAEPVLLVEQCAAIERIDEIVAVPGVREIHIGLNDLALDMGVGNRFAVLLSEEVERVSEATRRAGLRFGLGGLGRVDDATLPIRSDLLYAQHVRLRSTAALVSRRFAAADGDPAGLPGAVRAMPDRLAEWQANDSDAISAAHGELWRATAAAGVW